MANENEQKERWQEDAATNADNLPKTEVAHNLDTGEDEPLEKPDADDENIMDYGSGSGGGSAGDGAAS